MEEIGSQVAADNRAQHADHDIADQPITTRSQDPSGQKTGDQTHNDPRDKIHSDCHSSLYFLFDLLVVIIRRVSIASHVVQVSLF
jgi:hypothetical protein